MHFDGLTTEEASRLVPRRPVLVSYRGSIAHGTHIPPEQDGVDDIDIMVAYVPGLEHYFGLPRSPKGKDIKVKQWDCAAYEFAHFVSLLANGNPNVISMLWNEPKDHILVEREAAMLIEHRDLFLTKRLAKSFGGYARGQAHRMVHFDLERAGRSECGCNGQEFHATDCPASMEAGRGSGKRFATGFMGAKRKALAEKYGYDCKNAAHLIRLLSMAVEVFRDGRLHVSREGRPDGGADTLKDIKQGKWALAQVKDYADHLFHVMDDSAKESSLPEQPDFRAIEALVTDILSMSLGPETTLRSIRVLTDGLTQTHQPLAERLVFKQGE